MARKELTHLSRRERQIMDIVYREGAVSASEVQEQLPSPPSYSAVRAMLRVLEQKGHLKHRTDGSRYIYEPTLSHAKARRFAMDNLLQTFFDGSPEKAMAALLDMSKADLSDTDLGKLEVMIQAAREDGR